MAAALVAGIGLGAAIPVLFTPAPPPPRELSFSRITDTIDAEEWPAVSPDGKDIVFVRAAGGRRHIWSRRVGGGLPLRMTTDDVDHDFPRWLPDSSGVLFFTPSASEGEPGSLRSIPIGGTQSRPVAPATTGADVSGDGRIATFQKTPDGVVLAILDPDGATIATIKVKPALAYFPPRWSPDRRSIAYVASEGTQGEHRLYMTEVAGAPPEASVAQALRIAGISWLPDGSGLIYASSARSALTYPPTFQLRVVARDGSANRQLMPGEVSYVHPDIVENGKVITTRIRMRSDIWEFPATGGAERQITSQGSQVQTPSVSPDGAEIVYLSDSGGHSNLWIARTDRSGDPRQLTFETNPGVSIGIPVWSPTGDRIAFVKFESDGPSEYVIDPRGRDKERLLVKGGTSAAWSPDGEWLYYQKHSGPASDIFRIRADGTGDEIPVRRDASIPAISRDGTLYYTPGGPATANEIFVFKANPEGSTGEPFVSYVRSRMPLWPTGISLSPDSNMLAVPLLDGGTTNLWVASTATGEWRQVTSFGHKPIMIARQVAWSPNSQFIYAAVLENHADVLVLDGLDTAVRPAR